MNEKALRSENRRSKFNCIELRAFIISLLDIVLQVQNCVAKP